MTNKRQNVRAPIKDGGPVATKKIRRQIGAVTKLDMSAYEDQYPNKKLAVVVDRDGEIQRWLDAGAKPIPSQLPERDIYPGLNDKKDGGWVRFPTMDADGAYAYGLMMDPEDYDAWKLAPQRQRHDDIQKAMENGVSSEGTAQLDSGNKVDSYAPNLPTGKGQGYNEIRPK